MLPEIHDFVSLAGRRWPGDLLENVELRRRETGGLEVAITLSRCTLLTSFTLRPEANRPDRVVLDFSDWPGGQPDDAAAGLIGPQCAAGSAQLAGNPPPPTTPEPETRPSQRRAAAKKDPPPQAAASRYVSTRMQSVAAPRWQLSGTWEHEWAIAEQGGNQKFESLVQPRIDLTLADRLQLTAIARLRLDGSGDLGPADGHPNNYSSINGFWYNQDNVALDLREVFLDWESGNTFVRLGRQQVVWGQADGFKVLDVVNPQSFREFILDDFDDSRIPLWMVNAEWSLSAEDTLQLLWIPDATFHELPEPATPYSFTSPLLIPSAATAPGAVVVPPRRPDGLLGASEVGARYRTLAQGWDLSLNYLYSYGDFPVFQRARVSAGGTELTVLRPDYRRHHLMGGTASTTLGGIVLRLEMAWNNKRWFPLSGIENAAMGESGELSSVVGLDWQRGSGSLFSAQWFYNLATDHSPSMERTRAEHIVSLLAQQSFLNDSWQLRFLALHSLDWQDTMVQVKLKHWLTGRLEVWAGADLFSGDRQGLFGQFDDQDRVLFGLRYGF